MYRHEIPNSKLTLKNILANSFIFFNKQNDKKNSLSLFQKYFRPDMKIN